MHLGKWFVFGIVATIVSVSFAEEAADRKTATSLTYVTHELETRQNKFGAEQNKAMEYTNAAGTVQKRAVTSDLDNGGTESLPMVGGVNTKLNQKQDDIAAFNDHTAVTYTGQPGGIGKKGIYQATGTYSDQSDNLIDAKTFNAALKNGLDSEFICSEFKPDTDLCWVYSIHNNTMPEGYTPLDFIGSSGTQYIDTRILPGAAPKFIIEWSPTATGSNYLTGARLASGTDFCSIMGTSAGHTINSTIGRSSTTGISISFDMLRTLNDWYRNESTIEYDETNGYRGKFILDNLTHHTQEIKYSNYEAGPLITETEQSILVFAVRPNNIHPGVRIRRYQYFANYTDTTPTMDLVPCRQNSDDVLGMCDIVSGTFFRNAGQGTFSAGPEISNIHIYIPQNQ